MHVPGAVLLNRYRLDSVIGEGGMAVVWRGVHLALDRPVAIKFIRQIVGGAASLEERFTREARATALVRHRNVVDIIDYGIDEFGTQFIVMELLEGESLADRLEREPRPDI